MRIGLTAPTRQGTRALPYKVLRCRARADRVVRPYKPRCRGRHLHWPGGRKHIVLRRAGFPQPAAGSCTALLVKPPVIAKPVTDVTGCGNPSPVPSACLPKGGEADWGILPRTNSQKMCSRSPRKYPSTNLWLVPLPLGKGGDVLPPSFPSHPFPFHLISEVFL